MDILNEVSARLVRAPASIRPDSPRVLDELQAFILIDPLLAGLQKEYLDARATRAQAQREYGAGDGMTDMAMMMEDSAWCAMQTRLMEVRADRAKRAEANGLIEDSRREEEERETKAKKEEALRVIDHLLMTMRMREIQEERNKNYGGWFLFFMLMMNGQGQIDLFRNHHASYRFNQLAA